MDQKVVELDIKDILPNRFQPRIKFEEEPINELAESIKEYGVIQPIVVRPINDKYEIIAGERRFKASVIAGKQTIPALITDMDDRESVEIALIENVQRKDLTPIEEAISYKKILDMGYLKQDDLAKKLGKSQSTVANKLRLLNLDDEVQEALLEQKISERHARSLLRLNDFALQKKVLADIIEKRLTVRKTDEVINKIIDEKQRGKIIDIDDMIEKENNMNINSNFNMPTDPIINDNAGSNPNNESGNGAVWTNSNVNNEPKEEPKPVTPQYDANGNIINPGFMDVDKIEKQAQDIYVERPVADMNSLLNSEPSMNQVNNQVSPQPSVEAPSVEPQMVNNMDVNSQVNPQAVVDDSDLKPSKFFNILKEEPTVNTFDGGNSDVNSNPSVFSQPNVDMNNGMAAPSNDVNGMNNGVNVQPTMDSNVNMGFNTEVTPQPTVETPSVEPQMVNNMDVNNQVNPQPSVQPNFNAFNTFQQPVMNQNANTFNPTIQEPTTLSDFEMNNQPIPNMQVETKEQVVKNINDAIASIRNNINSLMSMGYNIDSEEIDFEDHYQINIRIEKNN